MIFLLLSPIGFFLVFRVLLPVMWCVNFIFTSLNHPYYDLVLYHLFYLILEGILTIWLMINIVNIVRIYRNSKNHEFSTQSKGYKMATLALLGIIVFLLFNLNELPIFGERGSDSIVELGEMKKKSVWFWYGILQVFITMILYTVFYVKKTAIKFIFVGILLIVGAVTGKKSAVFSIFTQIIMMYYIFTKSKPSLSIIKIGIIVIGFFVSSYFAVIQYFRTIGSTFEFVQLSSIVQYFNILWNLVYSSATIYLEQMISLEGVQYAKMYSDSLGTGGWIIYLLNPITKFLFGYGIYKSIGPFLNEALFGFEFPNGVNPVLFFEYIFVFGDHLSIILAYLNLIIIFIFAKYAFRKMVFTFETNSLVSITYYYLFLGAFSFLADSLNTIRMLPFYLMPLLTHYFIKVLKLRNSNRN